MPVVKKRPDGGSVRALLFVVTLAAGTIGAAEEPAPEAKVLAPARAAMEKGLAEEALALCLRGLEAYPASHALHHEAARALRELSQPETAARHLEAALELHPGHVPSLVMLALVRSDEGRLAEAAGLLAKAIELEPQSAAARHDLAVVEARRGNLEAAVAEFRRAAELAPRESKVKYGLGSALEKMGKLEEARAELEAACALDPSYPPPRYRLSAVLFRLGRKEEGERELRRFRELKAAVHAHRGEALARRKDLAGAAREYQRAVDALPDHAVTHGRLGSLYLDLGRSRARHRPRAEGGRARSERASIRESLLGREGERRLRRVASLDTEGRRDGAGEEGVHRAAGGHPGGAPEVRRHLARLLIALAALAGAPGAGAQIVFTEVAERSGVRFRHSDGSCEKRYFAEQVGGGAAFLDADGDGRLDLYLTGGVPLPGCPPAEGPGSRLFRNEGGGAFADGTARSGLGEPGYATGVAAGDIEGDGDTDLFVACYGPDRLYRNGGGGTFGDIAAEAGVADPSFGASATFLDIEADGDLDLFVTNYVAVGPANERACFRGKVPAYCLPQDYPGEPDRLYRNDGKGKFTDATIECGVRSERARGLGVAACDHDGDGRIDIFVANDTTENELFHNEGGGKFSERGLSAGVAFGEDGTLQNGMGTDWGDHDGDGLLDVVVTNFETQANSLFRNLGDGFFIDVSWTSGIGEPGFPYVGWAAIFSDFDLDGLLDLFIANGHVFDNAREIQEGGSWEQPCLVHRNAGGGKFTTTKLGAAEGCAPRSSRGAAAGDYDDDGDVDIAVNNLRAPPFLLRNDSPRAGRKWFGIELRGTRSNRSAIGARLTLRAGGPIQVREVKGGSGYLGQNDFRVVFGLADAAKIERLEVRWPGGATEDITGAVKLGGLREGRRGRRQRLTMKLGRPMGLGLSSSSKRTSGVRVPVASRSISKPNVPPAGTGGRFSSSRRTLSSASTYLPSDRIRACRNTRMDPAGRSVGVRISSRQALWARRRGRV